MSNPWDRNAGKYDRPSSSPISGAAVRPRREPTMPPDQPPKALPPGVPAWDEGRDMGTVLLVIERPSGRMASDAFPPFDCLVKTEEKAAKARPIGKRIRRENP